MDVVTLNGKDYEKSSIVAKRFGYTTDYLGQLSRSDKVEAELVGRSWYVYAPSVAEYQSSLDEADDSESTSIPVHTLPTPKKRVPADPVTHVSVASNDRKTKVAITTTASTQTTVIQPSSPTPDRRAKTISSRREPRIPHWRKQVSYHADDNSLLPKLDRAAAAAAIERESSVPPVAESLPTRNLKVHAASTNYSIVPSELPSVRLKGSVSIKQVDESEPKNKNISSVRGKKYLETVSQIKSLSDADDTKKRESVTQPPSSSQKTKKLSFSPQTVERSFRFNSRAGKVYHKAVDTDTVSGISESPEKMQSGHNNHVTPAQVSLEKVDSLAPPVASYDDEVSGRLSSVSLLVWVFLGISFICLIAIVFIDVTYVHSGAPDEARMFYVSWRWPW